MNTLIYDGFSEGKDDAESECLTKIVLSLHVVRLFCGFLRLWCLALSNLPGPRDLISNHLPLLSPLPPFKRVILFLCVYPPLLNVPDIAPRALQRAYRTRK